MKIRQLAAIGAGDGTCVAAALGCINRTRAPRDDANKGRSWGPSSGSRTVHCSKLTMRFETREYVGMLTWDPPPSIEAVEQLLQASLGREIGAIGDLDVIE